MYLKIQFPNRFCSNVNYYSKVYRFFLLLFYCSLSRSSSLTIERLVPATSKIFVVNTLLPQTFICKNQMSNIFIQNSALCFKKISIIFKIVNPWGNERRHQLTYCCCSCSHCHCCCSGCGSRRCCCRSQ